MYTAHHGMHLTEEHFSAIAEHFTATLEELNIAPEVIQDAVKVVATTHDDIVGH
jgi:hemoglobin